jgi:hypothetical protein
MVISKNSMSYVLNKKQRKKLIYLYEEYIKDRNNSDDFFTESATDCDKDIAGTTFYTDTVNFANNATWTMQEKFPPHKRMTLKKAKEILANLKKEESEDND